MRIRLKFFWSSLGEDFLKFSNGIDRSELLLEQNEDSDWGYVKAGILVQTNWTFQIETRVQVEKQPGHGKLIATKRQVQ